jgi:transcription antitermination protein NusB
MQALYAHFKSDGRSIEISEKELFHSISRSYTLFHLILLLVVEMSELARKKMDVAREKRIPSFQDLNPNTRFIENVIIKAIADNSGFMQFCEQQSLNWNQYPELIKNLILRTEEAGFYQKYLAASETSFDTDKKLILHIYRDIILESDMLYQVLEEQSIYWNDEADYMIMMVIKTIKEFTDEAGQSPVLVHQFDTADDLEFVKTLFRKTIIRNDETIELIKKFTDNWDIERIAFIDLLLMQMAITEMVEFPFIPTKVSLNEYIEISKHYSTSSSSTFINGILDKLTHHLKEQKIINKKGKGLIGEIA